MRLATIRGLISIVIALYLHRRTTCKRKHKIPTIYAHWHRELWELKSYVRI